MISIPKTTRLSDFLATFAMPCAPSSLQAISHKEIKGGAQQWLHRMPVEWP